MENKQHEEFLPNELLDDKILVEKKKKEQKENFPNDAQHHFDAALQYLLCGLLGTRWSVPPLGGSAQLFWAHRGVWAMAMVCSHQLCEGMQSLPLHAQLLFLISASLIIHVINCSS